MAQIVARPGPGQVFQPRPIGPQPAVAPATPIILYDSVTVAAGQELPFKSKAFLNNRSRTISLRELRVNVVIPASSVQYYYLTPALVALQLVLRRKGGRTVPLTRGYVPVSSLCRSDNRYVETTATTAGSDSAVGGMSWQFAEPLNLMPGDLIEAQVKNLGIASVSATVDLTFAGADCVGTPGRVVPYAVYWQSKDFAYDETAVDSAPPDQLANDTGTELQVDRIIGRFLVRNEFSGYDYILDVPDLSNQSFLQASLRMSLARGRPILRAFTPFAAVFSNNAAMETGFKLAPGDYLNVDVQHTASPALLVPFTYFIGRAYFSLVGCREAP